MGDTGYFYYLYERYGQRVSWAGRVQTSKEGVCPNKKITPLSSKY